LALNDTRDNLVACLQALNHLRRDATVHTNSNLYFLLAAIVIDHRDHCWPASTRTALATFSKTRCSSTRPGSLTRGQTVTCWQRAGEFTAPALNSFGIRRPTTGSTVGPAGSPRPIQKPERTHGDGEYVLG
jgi:hypothetical protein